MCPFSSQAISLLDETNRRNLKFQPSYLFEENLPLFATLNWKPQFRFAETFHSTLLSGEETVCQFFAQVICLL